MITALRVVQQLGVDHRQERRVVADVVLDQQDHLHARPRRCRARVAPVLDRLDDRHQDAGVALPEEHPLEAAQRPCAPGTRLSSRVSHASSTTGTSRPSPAGPAGQLGGVHVGEVRGGEDQVDPACSRAIRSASVARGDARERGGVVQVEVAELAEQPLGELADLLEDERVVGRRDEQDVHDAVAHQVLVLVREAASRRSGRHLSLAPGRIARPRHPLAAPRANRRKLRELRGAATPPSRGARLSLDNGAREPTDRFRAPFDFVALPGRKEQKPMSTSVEAKAATGDFKVKDLSLAEWGRKEIRIAENEMPGLMAIREEYATSQPLKGARITGSPAHDDPDRGADRDAAGARRRGALGVVQHLLDAGPRGRRDRRRAAPPSSPCKGETLEEYWDYTHRIFEWPDGGLANMILDDGGDATLLVHLGARAEKDASVLAKPDQRGGARALRRDQEAPRREAGLVFQAARRDHAASPRRPRPASTGSTRCTSGASSGSRRSTSTTPSPSRSSTTSTAAANRSSTASSARPT